jgi:hypothetical protein
MRRVIGSFGMKPGFWRLIATAGIGNTRNWPIWHVWKAGSANLV